MGSRVQSASAVVGTILAQLPLRCDDNYTSNMDRILEASDASAPPSLDILLDTLKQAASDDVLNLETVILLDGWNVKNMDNVDDFTKTLEVLVNPSWRLFITSCTSHQAPILDSFERQLVDVDSDHAKNTAFSFSRSESDAGISTTQHVLSLDDPYRSRSESNAVDQQRLYVVQL